MRRLRVIALELERNQTKVSNVDRVPQQKKRTKKTKRQEQRTTEPPFLTKKKGENET